MSLRRFLPFPALLALTGCMPLTEGLYVFTPGAITDDTCGVSDVSDFEPDDATVTWEDEQTLKIRRADGDMYMDWDGEWITWENEWLWALDPTCDEGWREEWTGTIPDRRTLDFDVYIELVHEGECSFSQGGEGTLCSFTVEFLGEMQI